MIFFFIDIEIKQLESKYKWHYARIISKYNLKNYDYRKSSRLRQLRDEINEKKFILTMRYLKNKLPDEIKYEIYKFL